MTDLFHFIFLFITRFFKISKLDAPSYRVNDSKQSYHLSYLIHLWSDTYYVECYVLNVLYVILVLIKVTTIIFYPNQITFFRIPTLPIILWLLCHRKWLETFVTHHARLWQMESVQLNSIKKQL